MLNFFLASDLNSLLPSEYAAPVGVGLGLANIALRRVTRSPMFQGHNENEHDPYYEEEDAW